MLLEINRHIEIMNLSWNCVWVCLFIIYLFKSVSLSRDLFDAGVQYWLVCAWPKQFSPLFKMNLVNDAIVYALTFDENWIFHFCLFFASHLTLCESCELKRKENKKQQDNKNNSYRWAASERLWDARVNCWRRSKSEAFSPQKQQ